MKKFFITLLIILNCPFVYCQTGWNLVANYSNVLLNRTIFLDENIGFSVGMYDGIRWIIYKTTNGGNNWSYIMSTQGGSSDLKSVYFINNNTGFAVGGNPSEGPIFLKTTNQGVNWILQSLNISNSNYLYDISFFNENLGYIVGYGGLILKTINGGNNWSQLNSGTGNTLRKIQIAHDNSNYIYIVGQSSFFLKSTNGGNNWNIIPFATGEVITSLSFANSNTGYVSGGKYWAPDTLKLYKTINSGENWINLSENIQQKRQGVLFFVDENTGYIGAEKIFKTTNGGINWRLQESFPWSTIYFDIFFPNQNFGIITAGWQSIYNSFFLKTTTGGDGVPWAPSNLTCYRKYSVNKLSWSDGSIIELGFKIQRKNLPDTLWNTIDSVAANITQYNDSNSTAEVHYRVCAFNEYGNSNYTNEAVPIILSIQNKENIVKYSLYQNFPNPFNPTTKIKFDLRQSSNTKLIVYNILGKEIATLVNEKLSAGSYEVSWDASGYPSGVYFYRLSADGNVINTRKMVLIK